MVCLMSSWRTSRNKFECVAAVPGGLGRPIGIPLPPQRKGLEFPAAPVPSLGLPLSLSQKFFGLPAKNFAPSSAFKFQRPTGGLTSKPHSAPISSLPILKLPRKRLENLRWPRGQAKLSPSRVGAPLSGNQDPSLLPDYVKAAGLTTMSIQPPTVSSPPNIGALKLAPGQSTAIEKHETLPLPTLRMGTGQPNAILARYDKVRPAMLSWNELALPQSQQKLHVSPTTAFEQGPGELVDTQAGVPPVNTGHVDMPVSDVLQWSDTRGNSVAAPIARAPDVYQNTPMTPVTQLHLQGPTSLNVSAAQATSFVSPLYDSRAPPFTSQEAMGPSLHTDTFSDLSSLPETAPDWPVATQNQSSTSSNELELLTPSIPARPELVKEQGWETAAESPTVATPAETVHQIEELNSTSQDMAAFDTTTASNMLPIEPLVPTEPVSHKETPTPSETTSTETSDSSSQSHDQATVPVPTETIVREEIPVTTESAAATERPTERQAAGPMEAQSTSQ